MIEPGLVAGQRFIWEAFVGETCVVRIAVNWLMGEEHLDPAWDFGPEGERFEVEVQGDPNTFVTIKGWQPETVEEGLVRNPGVVATAMHCRELDPLRRGRRARHQDLPGPAADRRPGAPRPQLTPQPIAQCDR